jgi:hypothetical protein
VSGPEVAVAGGAVETPVAPVMVAPAGLTLIGDATAASCEGDSCSL